MKKQRAMAFILAVSVMASMLSSCASPAAPATPADPAVAAPADPAAPAKTDAAAPEKKDNRVLSIISSQDWIRESQIAVMDKFTQETGVKVDLQVVPADQYFNLLLTKLNSGECADIFMSQSSTFDIQSQLQITKNGADLSDQPWVKDMDPVVLSQVSVDGKVYGTTIYDVYDPYCVIYNKKIFTELGLSIPTSFAQFKEVCDKLIASQITPVYECVSDGWHHVLWFAELGYQYDKENPGLVEKLNTNQEKFENVATMKTALTQYKEMADLGYWGDNYMSNTFADTAMSMGSGKFAMTVSQLGMVNSIIEANPELTADDFGFFPYPLADNTKTANNPTGPSMFVYANSKNIDLAKQFLTYTTQPENLQYILDNEPRFNNLPFTTVKNSYTPAINEFFTNYRDEKAVIYQIAIKYLNPQWMDMGKDLSAILVDSMTPDQMLSSIDQRRGEQAKTAGDSAWK